MKGKLKLYGFNNLTKTLSFNIYDICYAETQSDKEEYVKYIDTHYNSTRLTKILCQVTQMIGASVLNISKQDYEPQGASASILITEDEIDDAHIDPSCNKGADSCAGESDEILAHLDKSHMSVHTYPETHPENNVSTFRVDIDISTCGTISPLSALNYLISSFSSDIIAIDYRVRGFTRDLSGKKCFIDHCIGSIRDYIDDKTLEEYDSIDVNVLQSNIFHTKMMKKNLELDDYLFKTDAADLTKRQQDEMTEKLHKEMVEIYCGTNIY